MKKEVWFKWLLFFWMAAIPVFVRPSETNVGDSVQISLITCSPGTAVYELYGHTAIRYENYTDGVDVVFNYGLFSFETPNFAWRFMRGETDYRVGATDFVHFQKEYLTRGSTITLQMLNLTAEEKDRFWRLIRENCLPDNRIYRYDFLYNNCATKARDKIAESVSGDIIYAFPDSLQTFRSIIHHYTAEYPWTQFGIDLLLGAEADRPIENYYQMFAPLLLKDYFNTALVRDTLEERPLVWKEQILKPTGCLEKEASFPLSPLQIMILLFLFTAVVCAFELYVEKMQWWYDILLYGLQGVVGCVVTFMFFFSEHPTVDSNSLLIFLNPLPLLFLPLMIVRGIQKKPSVLYTVMLLLLVGFVVESLFVPQYFSLPVYSFVATLLLRTIHHAIFLRYSRRSGRKKKVLA